MGGMKVALAWDSGTGIAYRLYAPQEAWFAVVTRRTVRVLLIPRSFPTQTFRRLAHRTHVLIRRFHNRQARVAYQQVLVERRRISRVERIHDVAFGDLFRLGRAGSGVQAHGVYA